MSEPLNWDEFQLFLSAARAGGLARAVPITRVGALWYERQASGMKQARLCEHPSFAHAGKRKLIVRADAGLEILG